jgi:hypothetical protein
LGKSFGFNKFELIILFNMKYSLIVLITISLLLATKSSTITNLLWQENFISDVTSVNYLNSEELLLASRRGMLFKVHLNDGDMSLKKNLIYENNYEIASEGESN